VTVDAAQWSSLDDKDARAVATSIARQSGAALIDIRAGRRTRTALFDLNGEHLAFVPGGEVRLGYDGDRFPADVITRGFVDARTSDPRTVSVPSLLVAVDAVEAGAVKVSPDDPDIIELLTELRDTLPGNLTRPRQIEISQQARVVLRPNGAVAAAWLLDTPSFDAEIQRLAALGQRLLTPDEWEHACGAGATTLFRWGDTVPAGNDPTTATRGPHHQPNAFGLRIATDPYLAERTANRAVICGGDGGGAVCGGAQGLTAWLTVATSFRDAEFSTWTVENEEHVDQMFVRPAIALT
jgi:hypothetical protein